MTTPDATDLVGNWLMDKADPAIEADRQVLAAWREIRKRLADEDLLESTAKHYQTDLNVLRLQAASRRCPACGHEDRP